MREIKFRAWSEKGNKMFNVDVLAISPCTWDCPDYGKRGVSLAYQPSIKVMQYTGLKDKNGKEVYEGDIVRMHYFFENHHPVTLGAFEDEEEIVCKLSITPLGVYFENNNMTGYLCDYLEDPSEELEVIGNIHDNPDLLGGPYED